MQTKEFFNIFLGLVFVVLLLIPGVTHSASLYFSPASGNYEVGKQFSIGVFTSVQEQEINAVEAVISSIGNNIELVSVSKWGSIIDFWAIEPQINNDGNVFFEGVMLGHGYLGSAGKIATIVLRANSPGKATISFASGALYANDGEGTMVYADLGTASFTIYPAEEKPILELLFDINLELDDSSITSAKDLLARVIFTNFGVAPTPVDLTFKILDEMGNRVYISQDTLTVETEVVFTKEFKYLDLPVGKYKLELTTLYNTDVEDKFYADFEIIEMIEEEVVYPTIIGCWIWMSITAFLAVIVILLLLIIVPLFRRMMRYRKWQDKRILKKEEEILRQTYKRILTIKAKTEKELQKIENKLKKFSKKDDSSKHA